MSAFKNLLKSDTPVGDKTSRRSGQGSHFRSKETPEQDLTGDNATGTTSTSATAPGFERQGAGPTDTRAVAAPIDHARDTAGPEASGRQHVTSATRGDAQQFRGQDTSLQDENMPGGFPSPGYENPYRASQLDPRVDGSKAGSVPETERFRSGLSTGRSADAATARGTGSGLGTSSTPTDHTTGHTNRAATGTDSGYAGADESFQSTGPAHSTLTTAPNPADRSAEYQTAARTKVPDATTGTPFGTNTGTTTGTTSTTTDSSAHGGEEKQGLMGKMLGAVGLGGAAGGASTAPGSGKKSSVDDSQRSTLTSDRDSASPASGQSPPKYYRRESIPTTAYPTGSLTGPGATAAPVGGSRLSSSSVTDLAGVSTVYHNATTTGTRDIIPGYTEHTARTGTQDFTPSHAQPTARTGTQNLTPSHTQSTARTGTQDFTPSHGQPTTTSNSSHPHRDSGLGRDAAIGTVGAAGAGTGAYALHEHNRDTPDASRLSDRTVPPRSSAQHVNPIDAVAAAPSRFDEQDYQQRQPSAPYTAPTTSRTEDHTGRHAALGAGAAALGAGGYAAHEANKRDSTLPSSQAIEPTSSNQTNRSVPSSQTVGATPGTSTIGTTPTSQGFGTTPTTHAPGTGPAYQDVGKSPTYQTLGPTPTDQTVGMAPTTRATGTTADPTLRREDDHTGRNAALGAGAGAAAVGAGAYGAHEFSEREAAKEQAAQAKEFERQQREQEKAAAHEAKQHQKELEREQKQHQKELAKEEKAHEKEVERQQKEAQKAAAKEEQKHQKELEKEEHQREKEVAKHQRELEKEEQHRQRELEKEEERRHKALLAEQEEERKRREREAAAIGATGVAGAGVGAGVAAHEHEKERLATEPAEKEKKPSIFRRIFKRRQNKDTGLDEDYSTDEEEKSESHVPHHHSEGKGRNVLGAAGGGTTYSELSGGVQKPSYNPFSHDGGTADQYAAGPRDSRPVEPTTGLPYDPRKDEDAARRLSHEPTLGGSGTGTGVAGAGVTGAGVTGATGTTGSGFSSGDRRPTEPTTGLPYDPNKDPVAAERLETHAGHGGVAGSEHEGLGGRAQDAVHGLSFNAPHADHTNQNTRRAL